LRALTVVAAPVQLALPSTDLADPIERWWDLPELTRTQVLALLARLIARAVLLEPTDLAEEATDD
jgi:hypothetical protein